MLSVRDILEGWHNVLRRDPIVEERARERATVCSRCEHAKKMKIRVVWYQETEIESKACALCKCPLIAKIRATESDCPLNKWKR